MHIKIMPKAQTKLNKVIAVERIPTSVLKPS
jgi:hypothetical protein